MTDRLDKAVEAVGSMPPEIQETTAQAMLDLMNLGTPIAIPADDLQGVLAGLDEIGRGELVKDEEVKAAFRRFGR